MNEPTPATNPASANNSEMQCMQTMTFINDYLEKKSVPNSSEEVSQLWNSIDKVTKTLSLIFYKILYSEKRESSDRIFSTIKTKCPTVVIRYYIIRFLRYSLNGVISGGTLILILVYLDELRNKNAGTLFIERLNVHRLFAASYLVALKFCEDFFYTNTFMARVAGVSTAELNELEFKFLERVHSSLFLARIISTNIKLCLKIY